MGRQFAHRAPHARASAGPDGVVLRGLTWILGGALAGGSLAAPSSLAAAVAAPATAHEDEHANAGTHAETAAVRGPSEDRPPPDPAPETSRPGEPGEPGDHADGTRPRPPAADPNDAPRMPSPRQGWGPQRGAKTVRADEIPNRRRRISLQVVPLYAALKTPLFGRPLETHHGVGAGLELDVKLVRWLFLRAMAATSAHRLREATVETPDGRQALTARAGTFLATTTGMSAVYPLDLGRVLTMIDVGGGLLWTQGPEGVLDGQQGQPCIDGGRCDFGLSCTPSNVCQPTPTGQFNVGFSVDVLMGAHWSLGGQFRYYGLLATLGDAQIVTLGLRLGARW